MNKGLIVGLFVLGAMALELLVGIEPEPPKKKRKEAATRIRLQKSLRGKGNYDGPGCWKRGEGYVG